MKNLAIVLLFCVSAFSAVYCSPVGAPQAACETLAPFHGGEPQNVTAPFEIELPERSIRPGEKAYLITLKPDSPSGTFKGFIIQARAPYDTGYYRTLGRFGPFGPDDDVQFIECQRAADTVTHTNRQDKNQVQFIWYAPSPGIGDVVFTGSIVESYSVYYTNLESDRFTYGNVE